MELNGKHQLLAFDDNINMLGENLQTVTKKSSKDIDLVVYSEKTKYIISFSHQNVVQNQGIVIGNLSIENV